MFPSLNSTTYFYNRTDGVGVAANRRRLWIGVVPLQLVHRLLGDTHPLGNLVEVSDPFEAFP